MIKLCFNYFYIKLRIEYFDFSIVLTIGLWQMHNFFVRMRQFVSTVITINILCPLYSKSCRIKSLKVFKQRLNSILIWQKIEQTKNKISIVSKVYKTRRIRTRNMHVWQRYPKGIYRRNIGDYLRQPYLWVKYRSSSATLPLVDYSVIIDWIYDHISL